MGFAASGPPAPLPASRRAASSDCAAAVGSCPPEAAAACAEAGPACHTPDDAKASCWQCGSKWTCPQLYCTGCNSAQPVVSAKGVDFYSVMHLDPEAGFDLDPRELEGTYKELQKQLHPDRHTRSGALALEYSGAAAAIVNEAYNVLRNPLSRAIYLLRKRGMSVGEDCEGTISDPVLLMEIMEAREAVEDAGSVEELRAHRSEQGAKQAGLIRVLSDAFARGDERAALAAVNHLTYVNRILEEIDRRMPLE